VFASHMPPAMRGKGAAHPTSTVTTKFPSPIQQRANSRGHEIAARLTRFRNVSVRSLAASPKPAIRSASPTGCAEVSITPVETAP
jgi:hypothetical protein